MHAGVYFCVYRMSMIINTMNIARSMEMKKNERLFYEEPSIEVVEVKMECGLLQNSKLDYYYHSLDED